MNVVAVNGSHRRASNTSQMVGRALEVCESHGAEVEEIDLVEKDIGFCTTCGRCKDGFTCSIDDDVMDILETLSKADGIIIASPTYFGDTTSRLKALMDRSLPLRRNGFMLKGKYGAALAVGGSRNGGQELTVKMIHAFMLIHGMAVVGDVKNPHFGGICTAHKPASVVEDVQGMETVESAANNLMFHLKK